MITMGHPANVDHDSIDQMMTSIAQASESLKWITHMVERHMCAFSASASAHLAAGGGSRGRSGGSLRGIGLVSGSPRVMAHRLIDAMENLFS